MRGDDEENIKDIEDDIMADECFKKIDGKIQMMHSGPSRSKSQTFRMNNLQTLHNKSQQN